MENMGYAGFLKRLIAWIIDLIPLTIIGFIIGIVIDDNVSGILSVIITAGYFAGMESSSQQATIGKMIMGMYVIDNNGYRLSFGLAALRNLAKFLSAIFLIGFIMAAFTEKKQGLHDILAHTLVVDANA